jgi:hypothetical protein
MKDQEFLWEKLVGVIEENTLLKEKNAKLTKERDEAFARWENLNKDIKERVGIVRTDRVFEPTNFSEKLRIAVDYDPYLWRSSNFDFERELAMKIIETFRHEFNKHLKEKA